MKDSSKLVWLDSPDNFYWNAYVSGFTLGDGIGKLATSYYFEGYLAIFDSGTSLIYIPYSNYLILSENY